LLRQRLEIRHHQDRPRHGGHLDGDGQSRDVPHGQLQDLTMDALLDLLSDLSFDSPIVMMSLLVFLAAATLAFGVMASFHVRGSRRRPCSPVSACCSRRSCSPAPTASTGWPPGSPASSATSLPASMSAAASPRARPSIAPASPISWICWSCAPTPA